MENLTHPDHPVHDPALVERMLGKLHALVRDEIGDDRAPFDLNRLGTREVKYRNREASAAGAHQRLGGQAFLMLPTALRSPTRCRVPSGRHHHASQE